ncbi:MAG: hypothetical protein TQ35_0008705 [Candidatus Aramenus sulfurataquae]|uniref:Uncharacterized protein n=1 Tax=Candidatus Aramenus sulfurataquae TaxID=1326980 RepID=A0ACC6TQT3_9CREN
MKSPPLSLSLYAEAKYAVSERDVKVPSLPIGKCSSALEVCW